MKLKKVIFVVVFALLAATTFVQNASAQTINNGILTFPEGTREIANKAFYKNANIKQVIIPDTVTKIGNQAFSECSNLTEIDIPDSVKTIGDAAFQNCKSLSKVTLHEGLTKLNFRAFKNTAIKEIIIPSTVTGFGKDIFADCPNLKAIRVDKNSQAHVFFKDDPLLAFTSNPAVLGWKSGEFTTGWQEYVWEFEGSQFRKGVNTITYTYIKGAHKLCLKDAVIKADGKVILNDNSEKEAGALKSALYKFTLDAVPKKLTLTAQVHTSGGTDSNGTITVKQPAGNQESVLYIKDGTIKIENGLYKENEYITEIHIPASVRTIGDSAFKSVDGLKKVVIPGTVKTIESNAFALCFNLEEVIIEEGVEEIQKNAFYDCPKLNSVTIPKSIKKIESDGLFWNNKGSRVFHCYMASDAYNLAVKNGYNNIDILGVDEKNAASIDLSYLCLSGTKTVNAGAFRDYPFEQIDINNDITEIGKNAFNDKTIIRVKKNTVGDKWCRENGWYLCGVLADLSTYTKDRSKRIEEDFTRILCDDTPYAEWTSYKFNTQQPLKLEEVDDKLVLTSFMLYPCKNVTVTDKNGKALIKSKTIQPLTRTVLCDFDFLTDDVKNWTVTSDDEFYKRLISIPVSWNISFNGYVRRSPTDSLFSTLTPLYARQWIANVYDMAYVLGLPEYDERCYKAVENKELVTNQARTEYMTKERMEKLIKQARNWTLCLGMDIIGGIGGGNTLTLVSPWLLSLATSEDMWTTHAFWHEFSHCMGWAHEAGNMCNAELPDPWGKQCWPTIASRLYVEELKKGNPPYIENRKRFFNDNLFSKEFFDKEKPEHDEIKNDTLYIGEKMPYIESFKKNTGFTKVVIPDSVEVIKDSAFYDTRLAEISIPSSVTIINGSAFYGCLSLKEITIPDTVKSIGNGAFQNCTSLTSVKIGSGLRQLNKELFKKASALAEITIPGTVKYIGNAAFQDCKSLTNVIISDGVRKIGDNAFGGTAITEITIPASVTMIGKNITSKNVLWKVQEGTYAYQYAKENGFQIGSLSDKGKTIIAESKNAEAAPNDVWHDGAFTKEDTRRKWDFSDSLTGGGTYTVTFKYTSGSDILRLTDTIFTADGMTIAYFPEQRSVGSNYRETVYNITVPAGTKKLEMYALARAGKSNNSGTITVSNMSLKKLVLPASTETIKDSAYFGSKYEEVVLSFGLKKIGSMAFQDSTELKSITIPDSVTDTGNSVFQNCPALTTVKIGSGLTKINYRLFKNSALKQISVPGTVLTVGEEAFCDCLFLTKADISFGVTKIEKNAFNNCPELKSVSIPNSVTSIGQGAFAGSALTTVTIPASVTELGKQAFEDCSSLSSAKIGSGITTLCSKLFKGSGLTSITVPSNIQIIESEVFRYCLSLTKADISFGVTKIEKSAFKDCPELKSVSIPNSVTEIGELAFADSGLTSITIPASVMDIGKQAFQNCTSLATAKIGSGLTALSEKLFKNTGLTSATVPGNIETIGDEVFADCANLASVTIEKGVKQIGKKAFQGCKNLTKVEIKNGVEEICEKAFWDTGISEIKIPASVKAIGNNIVPKNTVWDVEVGTYAYQFALENNFTIKMTDAVLKDKTARLMADKNIESAPADKWQKGTFTSKDVRRKWDFSGSLGRNAGGTYTITFKYTGGAHKLSLTDSFIVADGRTIAYYPETLSAGSSPNKFVFTVEVPAGTKKLELYAFAKGSGGSDSNGTITVEKK